MLYSIDSGKYIESLPHKQDFNVWMARLTTSDYEKIVEALCVKIDASGSFLLISR